MKKRRSLIFTLVISLLVILFVPSVASADSTGVCFVSTGDNLQELNYMPTFVGGVPYVNSSIFADFGIYSNYFPADPTLLLYNSSKQIYFDLENGGSYDSFEIKYDDSATYGAGGVLVPVPFMCTYFDLSYSYISGTGNGDVLRIKNGTEVLSDDMFISAASYLMKTKLNSYLSQTQTPKQPETSSEPEETKSNTMVMLAFVGLPSDELLDLMDTYQFSACFFVDAKEACEEPDILRHIVCSGGSIGIYCKGTPENVYKEASEAIFEISQTQPTIMTAPDSASESCQRWAEDNGLAFFPISESSFVEGRNFSVSARLQGALYKETLVFRSDTVELNQLTNIFSLLKSGGYKTVPLRETF